MTTQKPILALLVLSLAVPALSAQRQRCGTSEPVLPPGAILASSDCGYLENTWQPEYEPTFTYDVPVVFHVIQSTSGEGFLSPAVIQDQIDVLNEDFQALPGSPGAPGTNARIRFHLAGEDPSGLPTTGITYSTNDNWFVDQGNYWDPLAWDTHRFLNIYTNAVPCCFGYVEGFPSAGGLVGQNRDRVVLWWEAVGKDPTIGWPLNMGRTASHEVGHYLGLYHTFCGGCGSLVNCDTTADLICDTEQESSATLGCPAVKSSCGSPDPIHNYMDYTDDPCLWEFTPLQAARMRCTLLFWRPDLAAVVASSVSRNGSGVNPPTFVELSPAIAGDVWGTTIDVATPGALASLIALTTSPPPPPGIVLPFGELLVAPPIVATDVSAVGVHQIPIPVDASLLGRTLPTQGATYSIGDLQLVNAIDVTIGEIL